jgi:NRPS condensation-like uncharacterized protein
VTPLSNVARERAQPAAWPLEPIEELDVYLDSPVEPSVIHLEVQADGHLDPVALQTALTIVMAADPAARRYLAASSRWSRRMHWEADPRRSPAMLTVARWHDREELAALREEVTAWPIQLRERSARLVLAVGPDRDAVILQTHHAAFDGISTLALLTSISESYRQCAAGIAGFGSPAPAIHQAARQAARREVPALRFRDPAAAAMIQRALSPVAAWLPGGVTRIAAQTKCPGQPGYGVVHRVVPVPRPPRQADQPSPTVNDVLVAAVIRTVDRWNSSHGRRSATIRVCVPVNNRGAGGRWSGQGNQTRLVRVAAGPTERADPARLLAHVAAQTRAGKQRQVEGLDATTRLLATGWAPTMLKRRVARLLRQVTGPLFATDTALISNLGVIPSPPSFGGAGPEPMFLSGPSQMPRGLGVGAVTLASGLHLCLGYQHALLDRDAAADFTEMYLQALAEVSGGRPA